MGSIMESLSVSDTEPRVSSPVGPAISSMLCLMRTANSLTKLQACLHKSPRIFSSSCLLRIPLHCLKTYPTASTVLFSMTGHALSNCTFSNHVSPLGDWKHNGDHAILMTA